MFANLKEGFDNMNFRQDLDNLFNNVMPNFIGTTAEGERLVRENPGIRRGLNAAIAGNVSGKYTNVPYQRFDTLFQSKEVPTAVLQQQEQCRAVDIDTAISSTNPAEKYRCGWLYEKDPTGIAPKISTGWLGSKDGPFDLFTDKPNGTWFWNLEDAKKQMLLDRCANVTSCDMLNSPLLKDACGWCAGGINKGFVRGPNGSPMYPTVIGQNCSAANIITSANKCPVAPPPRMDPITGLPIPTPEIGDLTCKQLPNGSLSRACLVQQIRNAGCNTEGSLARALTTGTNPTDYIANLRPNMAFMTYQERAPVKLSADILKDGKIGADQALAEFSGIASIAKGDPKSGLVVSARDLCTTAGAIDSFDFCTELTDSQPPPFSLDCLQKEWRKVGGLPAGAKYPKQSNLAEYQNFPTWGAYKQHVADMAAKTTSTEITIQEVALRDFMGINRETLGRPTLPNINAYEIFNFRMHTNDDALFMGRMLVNGATGMPIIVDSEKIPVLSGETNSSFILLTDLRPASEVNAVLAFPAGISNGVSMNINSDRERFWERNSDRPDDFRRDYPSSTANSMNRACTILKKGGNNKMKIYFNQTAGPAAQFRVLYGTCGGQANTPIPGNWLSLQQEIRAPMLSFEVRDAELRGRRSIGLHEARMPEWFIADNRNVFVEDRKTNAGPNNMKFIKFESTLSKWEVNKLMSAYSFNTMTFCFRLDRASKSPFEAIMAYRLGNFAMGVNSNNQVVVAMPDNLTTTYSTKIGTWYVACLTVKSAGGWSQNSVRFSLYEYNEARNGVTFNEPGKTVAKDYNRNNALGGFCIHSWGADSSSPTSAGFSMAWLRYYDYPLSVDDFKKDVNNTWIN